MMASGAGRRAKLWRCLIIILLLIFSTSCVHRRAGFENKKHIPVRLDKDTVLISFRLDDVSFSRRLERTIKSALYLARKYNVTYDLAISAQSLNLSPDQEIFKIYQNNQDVFEILAHGLDHRNQSGDSNNWSEFYDNVAKKAVPPRHPRRRHTKNEANI